MKNYLEFEKEIKSLEEDLEASKNPFDKDGIISEVDTDKIKKIQDDINEKLSLTYSNLNSWQKTLVARRDDRPRSNFYINKIFSDFTLLSGDRLFSDDKSIITGFGLIDDKSVLILGQEKGDDLNSRIERNFGMATSSGYLKAIRLMKLAERFEIPVISFIDTPGAAPTMESEKRSIAISIASSIECCMSLKVPNISIIIGEGGSGGAIALASSNKVIMLEHSIYSVISPEGCASILWRDPSKSLEAAQALKLSANELMKLGIVDEVIKEPLGGAHRDGEETALAIKKSILKNLKTFSGLSGQDIFDQRKMKFLKIGRDRGFKKSFDISGKGLGYVEPNLSRALRFVQSKKNILIAVLIMLILIIIFNVLM
jgi:acetyl-CoA carboxylase carboxyl transferase subunit alpha